MTRTEIVARLRSLAAREPNEVFREVRALADEIERSPEPDMEALVRVTQQPTRRARVLSLLRGRP